MAFIFIAPVRKFSYTRQDRIFSIKSLFFILMTSEGLERHKTLFPGKQIEKERISFRRGAFCGPSFQHILGASMNIR
jgi:hypothetical protein